MRLRPYQQRCDDALETYLRSGIQGNPLIVIPTASGKSVVQASFCRRALTEWPDRRIVCVTHVKELIEQNHAKMLACWPDAPAGIYAASIKRREAQARLLFASIQTVYNKAHEIGWADLLFIDEAHLVPANGEGMYLAFIEALRKYNPRLRVVGLTATPYRSGSGMLTDGDGRLFTDIIIDLSQGQELVNLIDDGYLSPLHPKDMDTHISVVGVGTVGGDFNNKQLNKAANQDHITRSAVAETMTYGRDRKSWLVFCAGVEHAHATRDIIREYGVDCETVYGDMPTEERERVLDAFKAGRLRSVTNANVLTTGFDHPGLDLIALLRPTKSASLHVQMLGRGMRVVYAPGHDLETREGRLAAIKAGPKQDCLVLDFAGNTDRLGPINAIRIPKGRRGKAGAGDAEAPTKTCPQCREINAIAARVCAGCGHEFPAPEKALAMTAGTSKIIVRQEDLLEWHGVDRVRYAIHQPPGKRASLKVTYECGLRMFHEWVCIGYDGWVGRKAADWWCFRRGGDAPLSAEEALRRKAELVTPSKIHVNHAQKYPEIVGYEFNANASAVAGGSAGDAQRSDATPSGFDAQGVRQLPLLPGHQQVGRPAL